MRKDVLSANSRTVLDIINIVAGLSLALSPWYLGFMGEKAAAWNAWLVGAAVTLIAIAALFAFHMVEEGANVVLGIWAVIAPWVLGFTTVSNAALVHVIAGLVVAVIAAGSLWFTTIRPYFAS